ncbi:MAG: hypothetical protein DSY76_06155 [Bacteroidetes bacterium]|nr:MAG: hypothetical protein DSY76_06155 [Bacteroidota bacterium]
MEKLFKIEAYLFFIAILLYMFTIKVDLPYLIYLFYSVFLSFYFFPLRVFAKYKLEKKLPLVLSSFSISWFLVYANLVHYIGEVSVLLQVFMLIMSLVNLFFLYYFYKKKNDGMALHLLAFAFIPMILYG